MKNKFFSKKLKVVLGGLLISFLLFFGGTSAFAITWGEEDLENNHPNVGLIMYSVPEYGIFPLCSGTLIHEKIFLTAGHCTVDLGMLLAEGMIDGVYVCFDQDPYAPDAALRAVAKIFVHPEYDDFRPRSNPHDVGALVLAEPVTDIQPAILPDADFLDLLRDEGALRQGSEGAKFIVVGYGASLCFPPPEIIYEGRRQFAVSEYQTLLKAWLKLSQNQAKDDGGTCYGDSGGPAFWIDPDGTKILVGITSWGDTNCVAMNFYYRTDIVETLDFIAAVLANE